MILFCKFPEQTGLNSPASAGRRRDTGIADSSRERGEQPPLARIPARWKGRALQRRHDQFDLGQPTSCSSLRRDWRAAEFGPARNTTSIRAFRPFGVCAWGNVDGRAVRSATPGTYRRGGSRCRGRHAICNYWRRSIQPLCHRSAGLCSGKHPGKPEQAGVGHSKWDRAAHCRPFSRLPDTSAFSRRPADSCGHRRRRSANVAVRFVPGDINPLDLWRDP